MVCRLKIWVTSDIFHEIIRSLTDCHSLVRLGFIVTNRGKLNHMNMWRETQFTAFFVDLVRKLPKLIALLVVLPDVLPLHCIAATKTLEKIFQPERPCFCVQITDSLRSINPPSLPQCHLQVLALDPPPLVGALPFHLLSRETRC